MLQLSSRDCDKWLSMTLTMKERFSAAWKEGRKRGGREMEGNERKKQQEGCVACVPSGV